MPPSAHLPPPHGGNLVDLLAGPDEAADLRRRCRDLPSWGLTERQLFDLELLLNGGFSPLRGFLGRADYDSVCDRMRLADGTLWPVPITLDLPEDLAGRLSPGSELVLLDPEGAALALLTVSDLWRPAPAVQPRGAHPVCAGGAVTGLRPPVHYDFAEHRHTPAQLRAWFARLGWRRVVAFHTRTPLHRAQRDVAFRAAADHEANLLLHPVVGPPRPDEMDAYTRVRCYRHVLRRLPAHTTRLSLLPLATRLAGPREALWHAIVRKNYGCSHVLVGPGHGGPADDPLAALELVRRHQDELGVTAIPIPDTGALADSELRRRLETDQPLPERFSFPDVLDELRHAYPPRGRRGFTVFLTGLSGAGKSTIANVLRVRLLELGGRPVTLLDGDIVRKNLSSELGFSRDHRDLNIRRIGFVASEITKNGGIAICAPIAPYDRIRKEVRDTITAVGGFTLVHVATSLDACEQRDTKGLYAKARAGIIKEFTGISDPYEVPDDADVVLDTVDTTPEGCAQQILLHLQSEGAIAPRLG